MRKRQSITNRLPESGDKKTAAHHAHIAHGHSAKATEQETEASKKYAEKYNPKK